MFGNGLLAISLILFFMLLLWVLSCGLQIMFHDADLEGRAGLTE